MVGELSVIAAAAAQRWGTLDRNRQQRTLPHLGTGFSNPQLRGGSVMYHAKAKVGLLQRNDLEQLSVGVKGVYHKYKVHFHTM
jgi:hypothetical protein